MTRFVKGRNSIRGLITWPLHKSAFSLAHGLLDQLIDPGAVPRRTAITRASHRVTQSVLVSFKARDEEPRANMCTHAFRCVPTARLRNRIRGLLSGAAAGRLFAVSGECVRLLSWTGKSEPPANTNTRDTNTEINSLSMRSR